MRSDTRRTFFGRMAALAAFSSAVPELFAHQTAPGTPAASVPQSPPLEMHVAEAATRTMGLPFFRDCANDGYPRKNEGNKDSNAWQE